MAKIKAPEMKNFNMRLNKDLWVFLKNEATIRESSMTDIIISCVEKHKKIIEKRLTKANADV